MAQGSERAGSGRPKRDGPRRGADGPRDTPRGDAKRTPPRREGRPERGKPAAAPASARKKPAAPRERRPGAEKPAPPVRQNRSERRAVENAGGVGPFGAESRDFDGGCPRKAG